LDFSKVKINILLLAFHPLIHAHHVIMAKKASRQSAVKPSDAVTSGSTRDADQGTKALVLDQSEVLKAMMAARKGKGRDTTPSEDERSGEETGSDEEDEEDDDDEKSGDEVEEEQESDESEGSSSSGQRRGVKRSRSASVESESAPTSPARQVSRVHETTSRVKLASTTTSAKPSTSKNPFDTPKAPSHTTFASLGLSQPLINALGGINIKKPTEIQSACVGPIMEGESFGNEGRQPSLK
jgi:ATP-dependent RNA helicase DDX49/DBP8